MSGGTGFSAAMLALLLLLPLAALLARRVPLGATAKMAAAWIGIFAVGLLIVTSAQRSGLRVDDALEVLGLRAQIVRGGVVAIPRGPDGHFWAEVSINGHRQRMLIDTGATTTGISSDTAQASGVMIDGGFGEMIDTANGTILAQRATADRFTLGPIEANGLGLRVAPSFSDGIIGMNFLSQLESWRVEGDRMILVPRKL